ncbi:MAG: helix-turn-helix transcriptional regulator [Rhizobiales bacterium]|nr:helix-turn-helix transcriptional regulator [Hyphomicrobiales bacterium]
MKARALVAWNLRRLRVERGISQEGLAYEANIDRAYVGGLERRSHNPTVDLLDRLAATLDVEIGEFFARVPKGALAPKPLPAGRKIVKKRRGKKQ